MSVLLVGAVALTGCSQAASPDSTASATTSAAAPVTTSATPKKTAKPTPTKAVAASLGGTCDDLVPVTTVDIALKVPITGQTAFVVGTAEKDIGRLTYLNCRYGLAAAKKGKPAPTPKVEIGISLYKSAAQAALRVQGTIEDFALHTGLRQDVHVGKYVGYILLGYGDPTIVVAAGPRTVAVTVLSKLLPSKTRASQLIALTQAVVTATEKYTGVPAASATTTG